MHTCSADDACITPMATHYSCRGASLNSLSKALHASDLALDLPWQLLCTKRPVHHLGSKGGFWDKIQLCSAPEQGSEVQTCNLVQADSCTTHCTIIVLIASGQEKCEAAQPCWQWFDQGAFVSTTLPIKAFCLKT